MNKKNSNVRYLFILLFLILVSMILVYQYRQYTELKPIKIAILHSLTGTLAESEKPLVGVLQMAISDVNENGGLLGRKLKTIIVDARSNPQFSAIAAERLIRDEKVDVIFGCWTSSCRKAVKPVVEKYKHILFYPVQYEGLEQSPNIVYTGAAPNQQIIPGVNWLLKNIGSEIYLLGSDYIFPRTANLIIRDIVEIKKSRIVAERYVTLGSDDFDEVISEIKSVKPHVILNTLNGSSNAYFFAKKNQAGLDNIPVVSFSIGESELLSIPEARTKNHYTVWNYFQSVDNPVNKIFVKHVKKILGVKQVVGDPMESSYTGFQFWVQAVRKAESTKPALVLRTINALTLNAPEGIISVNSRNHHLSKYVRIGQARTDGQFDIIFESEHVIRPVPYPSYRSRKQWKKIIKEITNQEKN